MDNNQLVKLINKLELNYNKYDTIVSKIAEAIHILPITVDQMLKTLINQDKLIKISADDGDRYATTDYFIFMSGAKDFGAKIGKMKTNGNTNYCDFPNGGESYIVDNKMLGGALNGDLVVVMPMGDYVNGKEKAKVVSVVKRKSTKVIGRLNLTKSFATITPHSKDFDNYTVLVDEKYLKNAKDGDIVEADIKSFSKHNIKTVINRILGKENDYATGLSAIYAECNVKTEFPDEVKRAADRIDTKISNEQKKGRKDLTHYNIYTIDGDDSKDFDDAIGILEHKPNGNMIVVVAIADVSEYVKISDQNNVISAEAFERGTSHYAPDRVYPMLPEVLSNNICSLNPNVDRLTLSCIMEVTPNGEVKQYNICKSIINSKYRLTYNKVQKIYENDQAVIDTYSDIYPDLMDLFDLSSKLKKKRKERGAINFETTENKIVVNEKGEFVVFESRPHNEAEQLIESLMILANECVAKFYDDKDLPFVYRVHEAPDAERVASFAEFAKSIGITFTYDKDNLNGNEFQNFLDSIKDPKIEEPLNNYMVRVMKKAKYSPDCIGHFGLGSTQYCHFTSPIRRLADLTIHNIISEYIAGKLTSERIEFYENFVENSSFKASKEEQKGDLAYREQLKYTNACYMKDKVGQVFKGVVSGARKGGLFVLLDNHVEVFVDQDLLPNDHYDFDPVLCALNGKRNKFRIGKEVSVQILSANPIIRRVDAKYIVSTNANTDVDAGEFKNKLSKLEYKKKQFDDYSKKHSNKSRKHKYNSDFSKKKQQEDEDYPY